MPTTSGAENVSSLVATVPSTGATRAIFTICSCNYLGQALTLMESVREFEPNCERYIVLVDRMTPALDLPAHSATFIWAEQLGIADFEFTAFRFDVLELNTNVKPTALKHLLRSHEAAVYLDPDTRLYGPLTTVWDALSTASIALTPHMLSPAPVDAQPSERDLLRFGVFNLGFVGVSATGEGPSFLTWWEARCLNHGYQSPADGLFVDQKFINLVPTYFQHVAILRDPGLNVAYWNLHSRMLSEHGSGWKVNRSADLAFMHFSGFIFTPDESDKHRITKYGCNVSLDARPDLLPLFAEYRAALARNGYGKYISLPYSFGAFDNSVPIPRLARRVAASVFSQGAPSAPFSAAGPLYACLSRAGLLTSMPAKRSLSVKGSAGDARIRGGVPETVQRVLRAVLRVIGVRRYELMLRGFQKLGSELNQGFLANSGRHDR